MNNGQPEVSTLGRPAYLSLAEQFARAVEKGALRAGTRLPPQGRLAYDLKLSVQIVSRSYGELIRRGLASGEVGRGSFVLPPAVESSPPYLVERSGEIVDLSILKPVNTVLGAAVADFALLRRSRNPWLARGTGFVVQFIRGTLLLVQLYFIFYMLPDLGIRLPALAAGVIGIGLHYAACSQPTTRQSRISTAFWRRAGSASMRRASRSPIPSPRNPLLQWQAP